MTKPPATDRSELSLDLVDEAMSDSRYEEALQYVLEALKAAEHRQDTLGQSRAHAKHSRVLSRMSLFADAVSAAHLALRLAGDDISSAALALDALGAASQTLTPPEAQFKLYEEMLSTARQAGEVELQASAVRGLCIANLIKYELSLTLDNVSADAPTMHGYVSEALRLALEAQSLSSSVADTPGVFMARHLRIGALILAGDFDSARGDSSDMLRDACASSSRDEAVFEAIALKHLGQLDLREGHLADAEAQIKEALALHEKRRDLRQCADCFRTLSAINEQRLDFKAALHWERRSSEAFMRFASASARAHAAAMEVRENAQRARTLAAVQSERADRLELSNLALAREALEDALTGIANRRSLDAKLAQLFSDRRSWRRCSLALLDIDNFKWVNDNLLHTTGDKVLARMGAIVREVSRENDFVARFGGEEFAVALVDIEASEVAAACERIRLAVAGVPWTELHPDLAVTVSIGFAHFNEARDSVEELVKVADARLFQAKRAGRNRVVGPSEGS